MSTNQEVQRLSRESKISGRQKKHKDFPYPVGRVTKTSYRVPLKML